MATLALACACTGSSGSARDGGSSTVAGSPHGLRSAEPGVQTAPAQLWWSNRAARAGSAVAMHGVDPAVAALRPSRDDYCTMLRQTKAAGRTLFAGVTPDDAAMRATIRAFVAEISAVAPANLARAWSTVGAAIVAVSSSGGDVGHVKGIDAATVRQSAATIAADASAHCRLTLGD
jgi:hypothetical protein